MVLLMVGKWGRGEGEKRGGGEEREGEGGKEKREDGEEEEESVCEVKPSWHSQKLVVCNDVLRDEYCK